MAYGIRVDNSAERFGDKTSIADLAANSFPGWDRAKRNIYEADQILARDWQWELEAIEMEYGTGISATFKDGSRLHVGADASCCREGDADYGDCKWCGGRY